MVRPASLLSFYLSRGGACEPHPPAAMAKYNVVLKNRREWNQNRKRQAHGEPGTGKLKQRTAPVSMSGKRKRKLQRRQNRVRLRIFFSVRSLGLDWCDGSASLIIIWCFLALQEQKETTMLKALENMGDVDMVSAEGAIHGGFLGFNLGGEKLGFHDIRLDCYQENLV
jgi:hypothetical protein